MKHYNDLKAMAESVMEAKQRVKDAQHDVFEGETGLVALLMHHGHTECFTINWNRVRQLIK